MLVEARVEHQERYQHEPPADAQETAQQARRDADGQQAPRPGRGQDSVVGGGGGAGWGAETVWCRKLMSAAAASLSFFGFFFFLSSRPRLSLPLAIAVGILEGGT